MIFGQCRKERRRAGSTPRRASLTLVLLFVALEGGCRAAGRTTAEQTILAFVDAVQAEDLDALHCLMAGASGPEDAPDEAAARREAFDAWARSRYEEYLTGRDQGQVKLEGDGIVLTKAFALGKGTYYTVTTARWRKDTMEAETLVRFAYGQIDISLLPPGSVFYVCGTSPGEVHPVKIPPGKGSVTVEALETMMVHWTLSRSPGTPSCPGGWTVASVSPLPETATESRITWEF